MVRQRDSLVMKDSYLPGFVSFDLESGMFEIRYTRILNKKERKIITADSTLIVVSCRYYHSSFHTGKGVIQ